VAAGAALTVKVTAQDANSGIASSYQGTVHFSSSDAAADLPADYTFTAADNGVHTFSVTLRSAGKQTLVVNDTTLPGLRGLAATSKEFITPTVNLSSAGIGGLTAGPDGNLWFTEQGYNGDKIGRITPTDTLIEFALPNSYSEPRGITVG